MKVIAYNIESYDITYNHVFEVEDTFVSNSNNALRFLKDIKREHHIHGKAFILAFPNDTYYFYRIKGGYKMYRIGESNENR